MAISLHYAARSDVGLIRANNQDSGYAGPNLLVLADGMGGAAGGDIASSVAVAHLAALDGDDHGADDILELLTGALTDAHTDLIEYSRARPELAGLGTTVVAMLVSGRTAAMVHVGDSRAYLLREHSLHQITQDHTFVQYLIDTGQITPAEAENHPQRSVILRVLGDSTDEVELDETVRELKAGDRWLLCSDGLSGMVSDETIAETLRHVTDPGACAEQLVDLALRGGGQDNITVVVADVTDDSAGASTVPQVVGAAAIDRARPTRGGSSAAARAAALVAAHTGAAPGADELEDDARDVDAPPRRRPWVRLLAVLVPLALLVTAVVLGYQWTQTQYFVAPDGDYVAIYQGVPQSIGPVELSHVTERTVIRLDDLPPFAQSRVERGISAVSLADATTIVAELTGEAR
ncbi:MULTISPECIES: Stp1/IreP family PP2C-type Ser/Thr phosphatase [unclassified Pseudactinotalea]|uniref:Stp1/IreP family PP2C-type Ser/Thr phosphatase n=1 Tax=unclassified Pseudactinotalea TaxID=2649176 RepID=UPI00128C8A98|nr:MULTISPECIES: Stp1/IreP family PP2C-type Ser/Thr phosphatase [unclassified Pseudactinotalea]MPV49185.1 Stp1/IreP family PP2C-type Ser/Thr phosphatase [Pseudactinotalea sp. HY160]QGH70851.1 Stp1/IreP family PP2C-type Ser/Thr phosphatase [Pseudactinotalea sp. HY158]